MFSSPALAHQFVLVPFHSSGYAKFTSELTRVAVHSGQYSVIDIECDAYHLRFQLQAHHAPLVNAESPAALPNCKRD
ncbi:MAG TPA: hypothetical protein VKP30_18365 [Polyangiaceae bacterium]|nr:hypothetical protein [Polyangiaceae bacterium]